ncbi:hypothetical protein [Herbaspirillum sp. RV1423]|nr:hypothetical protein [Herbaspirillum sp. RV1423]
MRAAIRSLFLLVMFAVAASRYAWLHAAKANGRIKVRIAVLIGTSGA